MNLTKILTFLLLIVCIGFAAGVPAFLILRNEFIKKGINTYVIGNCTKLIHGRYRTSVFEYSIKGRKYRFDAPTNDYFPGQKVILFINKNYPKDPLVGPRILFTESQFEKVAIHKFEPETSGISFTYFYDGNSYEQRTNLKSLCSERGLNGLKGLEEGIVVKEAYVNSKNPKIFAFLLFDAESSVYRTSTLPIKVDNKSPRY